MYHQKRGDTYTHCWIYANNILVASQSIEQHKVFVVFFKIHLNFLHSNSHSKEYKYQIKKPKQ